MNADHRFVTATALRPNLQAKPIDGCDGSPNADDSFRSIDGFAGDEIRSC
jgi:hypothetical protein